VAKSRDLRVRSFQFTVDVVRLCRERLVGDPIIRRLAYQLVDAAGSIGANLEESGAGQTKPDFIAKQFIALKEARESRFWLRVIDFHIYGGAEVGHGSVDRHRLNAGRPP
jgi:four helix bundle protein